MRTCEFAAQFGKLEVLQWARANGCPWDERTRAFATMAGQHDLADWAKANDCKNVNLVLTPD